MLKDVVDENDAENSEPKKERSPFVTLDLSDFPSRYRDVCPIGCGSRGLIFSAVDQQSLRRLAVKKLTVKQRNKEKFLRQVLREIRILHRLEHQNIIKIYHVLVSTGSINSVSATGKEPIPYSNDTPSIDSLYIGMELMDTDLRNVLQKSILSPDYIKLFMYQVLRGLKYMHSANVMHRDLNPSNIFINMDTLMVKIGDFGVSRLYDSEYDHTYHLSMPLTTKYYQAPELLLHPQHYTKAIDVWAVGCIFIEMFKGSPAFSGDHSLEQMNVILDTIPVRQDDWYSVVAAGCQDINCCAPATQYSLQSNDGCPQNPLESIIPDAEKAAINLLKQLLCFDPQLRIPAEDALSHPYFLLYSNPHDEPVSTRPFRIEDELDDYSTRDLEDMLQNESYSVTSSLSKSTDTNASQAGQTQTVDEWNFLRVNSGASLTTNSSYRHLLSLADPHNQPEVLSESEMRTMACDFEYGVQIHECSFNKDRMSMDFRPVLSDAGYFDPYKWNNSAGGSGPLPSNPAKKDLISSEAYKKASASTDQNHREVSRFDTGYNSSYCSSTMTNHSYGGLNRVSTAPSSMLWSLSSDVSSDHEHHTACATPDSVSSPPFNTTNDNSSAANSPVLLDDAQPDNLTSNRHSDVGLVHQGSSRHHHHHHHSHHHHHHSHHHRHHKHKNRQTHRDVASASNAASATNKPGSGDSSIDATAQGNSSDDSQRRKRTGSKKSKSFEKDRDAATSSPRNVVIVTGPDGEEVLDSNNECKKESSEDVSRAICQSQSPPLKEDKSASRDEHSVDKFDKKESIHEHLDSVSLNLLEHRSSAFTKYVSNKKESNALPDTTSQTPKDRIPLSFFAPDPGSDVQIQSDRTDSGITFEVPSNEDQSQSKGDSNNDAPSKSKAQSEVYAMLKSLGKSDASVLSHRSGLEPQRPRTWSEGCEGHGKEKDPISCQSITVKSNSGCSFVRKIRTQFSQLLSDRAIPFTAGCCLTSPDLTASTQLGQSEFTPISRIRHFSDDRCYVTSHPNYFSVEGVKRTHPGATSETPTNPPPPTCSSAKNIFPGSIKIPRTRVECPF